MTTSHPYLVRHLQSGDVAEADNIDAARLAARTLIEDNGREGHCLILVATGGFVPVEAIYPDACYR